MLNDEVPLIGFTGSPWTIMCYAVEGQGSKSFDKAKGFCFQYPEAAHVLLQKNTDTTILYLKKKKSGQMPFKFLTLGAECYLLLTIKIFMEIHQQIVEALADDIQ
jgi:uroporphyrinogen decarboxylase